jgi:6-phosphogluconolactonase (cycloisomerase 2 family)
MAHNNILVRVGSYTGGSHAGRGIVTARVAADGSRIERVGAIRVKDPSYLATDRSGRLLYTVGESGNGTLAAFRVAVNAHRHRRRRAAGSRSPGHAPRSTLRSLSSPAGTSRPP